MANTPISALSSGTTLTGTEVAPFVQASVTVKITANQIKAWALTNPVIITQTTVNLNPASLPAPIAAGLQVGNVDGSAAGVEAVAFASPAQNNGRRANGTGASPTAIASGNTIYVAVASGYDGTAWSTTGNSSVRFSAAENWSSTAHGTNIQLVVVAPGTVTATTAVVASSTSFIPGTDNALTCGSSTNRWSTVYAATALINTSDERDKTWRGSSTDAEVRAAKSIIGQLGFYQWNDAIAKKGADAARYHFGAKAQTVRDILTAEGLDATSYAFLCYDEWEAIEQHGEPGDEDYIAPRAAGDRWGLRPAELTLFLVSVLLASQ